MKIQELMHGDLFMYGGNVCRFMVSPNTAYLQRLSDGTQYLPCACIEAEPIPLTKDILAKAGYFCQRNYGDSWYISFSGSKRHIGTVEVKYLHELQQFRRLCGKEEISIKL